MSPWGNSSFFQGWQKFREAKGQEAKIPREAKVRDPKVPWPAMSIEQPSMALSDVLWSCMAFLWSRVSFLWPWIAFSWSLIGLLWSFLAVIHQNSFGLVFVLTKVMYSILYFYWFIHDLRPKWRNQIIHTIIHFGIVHKNVLCKYSEFESRLWELMSTHAIIVQQIRIGRYEFEKPLGFTENCKWFQNSRWLWKHKTCETVSSFRKIRSDSFLMNLILERYYVSYGYNIIIIKIRSYTVLARK